MKRKICLLLAIVASALSLLTSCSKTKDIKITSFEIVSVTPRGMNGLDALVKIGINNPSVAFELTDLVGTLKLEGVPCLSITADQLIVSGKTVKTYSVPLQGQMSEGFNPFQLLRIINGYSLDFDKLTVDVQGKASLRGGFGKKLEINDLKIGEYLVRNKNE
ncbi:MAG: hypothetical protein MJY89_02970 [Bacteroidales bacterium]|nr:hypothetical protein [Bacteroidales bacterium]